MVPFQPLQEHSKVVALTASSAKGGMRESRMPTDVSFHPVVPGSGGGLAKPSEQHNCGHVPCNNSYSRPITRIEQGEANLSFACLRFYAFEKSFLQGGWIAAMPFWSVLPSPGTFAHGHTPNAPPSRLPPTHQRQPLKPERQELPGPLGILTCALGHLPSKAEHANSQQPQDSYPPLCRKL